MLMMVEYNVLAAAAAAAAAVLMDCIVVAVGESRFASVLATEAAPVVAVSVMAVDAAAAVAAAAECGHDELAEGVAGGFEAVSGAEFAGTQSATDEGFDAAVEVPAAASEAMPQWTRSGMACVPEARIDSGTAS
jgi:hypothetical protein